MADEKDKKIKELEKRIEELEKNKRTSNAKQIIEENDLMRDQLELLASTARAVGDYDKARDFSLEAMKKHMIEVAEQTATNKEAFEDFKKSVEELGDEEILSLTNLKDFGGELEGIVKKFNDTTESSSKFAKTVKNDLENVFGEKGLAGKLGVTKTRTNEVVESLSNVMTQISINKLSFAELGKNMLDVIKKDFHFTKIGSSVLNKLYDNTMGVLKAFDSAQASIAKATGQGREFNDVLYESGRAGNLFGVSMDEAGEAISTMVAQTSAFTNLSKDLQAEVALNVAQMSELGIATSDSAEIFQNFNQSLGITASESIKMQKELAMAGVEVGIGASKITKDFNASLSTLMVYGRESINVFKGIAAAAKAAGVETSTLLNIAQQYDTFAGAAEGVGKLNSLLGTQLSTTEMLMATEDERIRMLVESVQSQGVAFQDMDRFTQKAVANAAGITDMAEANKIFGMSLKEYDENEKKLKASADVQKKFEDAVAATVPVMEKFQLLGAEMITALQPTFEVISNIAEGLTDMLKGMTTTEKNWAVGITAGLAAVATLAPLFMVGGPFLAGLAAMPASIAASGAAAGGAAVGFGALAASLAPIFKGILAVAAIGGLAYGLGSMFSGGEEKAEGITGPEVDAIQNLDNIMNADFSSALSTIKAIVGEASKLGSDMKVTSTIENLAMITSGQAKDISGNIVTASTTNVVAKVNNMFDGMKVNLIVDGYQVEGVFAGMQDGNERG